jgi:signal transduction histidine kinase
MKSIQRRLGLGLFGILLVVGVITAQTSLWLFDLGLRRYLQGNLREEAEILLTALSRGANGPQLNEQRLSPRYQRPWSGSYFRIDLGEQRWRSRSAWDFSLDKPTAAGLNPTLIAGPEDQQLLIYRADFQRFGQPLSISVAQDYTPILQASLRAQGLIVALGCSALLLILLLQRLNIRRALRPLEEARQQVQQLQQGERARLEQSVPQELEPLVTQINRLLEHTENSLKRSRHGLGNLGHALKTPLAVLLSLASRPELDNHPHLRSQLQEQLEQIQQRLARELNRARLAGDVMPAAHFDCATELPALLSTLRLLHPHLSDLRYHAPPHLRLHWEREDVLEVLGNLLDNACKWANSQVSLTIRQEPAGLLITIDDDGPGIPETERERLVSRGVRLDEQMPGHGLGLAIVRDTVEAWQGHLEFQRSPLGGLRVLLRLPLPQSDA